MKKYELLILAPINETSFKTARDRAAEILKAHDADILSEEDFGVRRLAYDVDGQKDGHYYIYNFTMQPSEVAGVETELKLEETVLKQMITVVDKLKEREEERKAELAEKRAKEREEANAAAAAAASASASVEEE